VQAVPEHRGAVVQAVRDRLGRYAQLPQEGVEHRGGVGGRLVRVEAAQVHEQLHVGVPARADQLVRRTDREPGLADARHALDRRHHHRRRRLR
jgi:hypothetical protein